MVTKDTHLNGVKSVKVLKFQANHLTLIIHFDSISFIFTVIFSIFLSMSFSHVQPPEFFRPVTAIDVVITRHSSSASGVFSSLAVTSSIDYFNTSEGDIM